MRERAIMNAYGDAMARGIRRSMGALAPDDSGTDAGVPGPQPTPSSVTNYVATPGVTPSLGVGPLTMTPDAAVTQAVTPSFWDNFVNSVSSPGGSFLGTYGLPIAIGIGAWLLLKKKR